MVIYQRKQDRYVEGSLSPINDVLNNYDKGELLITIEKCSYLNRGYSQEDTEVLRYFAYEHPSINIISTFRKVIFLKIVADEIDEATGEVGGQIADYYPMDLIVSIECFTY